MRLTSLKIERFRGIRSADIDGFVDVNILIGRNNSGKSTVVEAMTRLRHSGMSGSKDALGREPVDEWGLYRRDATNFSPRSWYRADTTEPLKISGVVSDDGRPIRILGLTANNPGDIKRTNEVDQEAPNAELTASGQWLSNLVVWRPSDGFLDFERVLWPRMYERRGDKYFTTAANELFDAGIESMTLVTDDQGTRLLLLYPDYSLPLDFSGDGMRTALRCLLFLTGRTDTVAVLEEPECHQHPGSLARFAKALCILAQSQRLQLFLTTHSIECVRFFLEAAEQSRLEGATFHFELEDGLLQARRLDRDAVERLLDTGLDVRNLDLYV